MTQELVAYASRTGTRVNLAGLRARGWRLLVSATGAHRAEGFPYAIDNGEWTAHQKVAKRWRDPGAVTRAFICLVITMGTGADWIAAPDIVAGGLASLAKSLKWLPWLLTHTRRVLIPVQDGMSVDDVRPHLNDRVGVFVGGSGGAGGWKERTIGMWAHLARERGAWCHVGRVNSVRRVAICSAAGANSFDGTNRLHGHTYEVEIVLGGPVDERTGMIVDYADIAEAWADVDAVLDHRYLNNIPGLEIPTTEVLAVWLLRRLNADLRLCSPTTGGSRVRRLRVKESSSTWCEVTQGDL